MKKNLLVQNLLSSYVIYINIKIKIYRTIFLLVGFVCVCVCVCVHETGVLYSGKNVG